MAKSHKNLGMGLDLLLTAAPTKEAVSQNASHSDLAQVLLDRALKQDEAGSFLEAYYLYRRIIDMGKNEAGWQEQISSSLLSQALNNAAIILYEHGNTEDACIFLQRAAEIDPDNRIARSNLDQLGESK